MAQQLHLKDGRIVEYLISGTDNGFPLVWLHGTPGAYLVDPAVLAAIKNKDVKVITLSRAGYGGSSRKQGRSVIDAVADVQALLDHLDIKRCLVGGYSGGGKLTTFQLHLNHQRRANVDMLTQVRTH